MSLRAKLVRLGPRWFEECVLSAQCLEGGRVTDLAYCVRRRNVGARSGATIVAVSFSPVSNGVPGSPARHRRAHSPHRRCRAPRADAFGCRDFLPTFAIVLPRKRREDWK